VTSAAAAKRSGRIFLDYLRNGRGTTAIGTYSPRARPGFPIAAPITWTQVEHRSAGRAPPFVGIILLSPSQAP
jgi:bifunctional non-homologous end joining protein LigD